MCLAFQSKGENEEADWEKEHGMMLIASEWNGVVAEAEMQVSQHSVELKVQLLTGRKRGEGRRGVGGRTERSPL